MTAPESKGTNAKLLSGVVWPNLPHFADPKDVERWARAMYQALDKLKASFTGTAITQVIDAHTGLALPAIPNKHLCYRLEWHCDEQKLVWVETGDSCDPVSVSPDYSGFTSGTWVDLASINPVPWNGVQYDHSFGTASVNVTEGSPGVWTLHVGGSAGNYCEYTNSSPSGTFTLSLAMVAGGVVYPGTVDVTPNY